MSKAKVGLREVRVLRSIFKWNYLLKKEGQYIKITEQRLKILRLKSLGAVHGHYIILDINL